jgi:hypothetical protein
MFWDLNPNQDELEYKVTMRLGFNAYGNPWIVKASGVKGNMVTLTDLGPAGTEYDVCVYGRIIGSGPYHQSCTKVQITMQSAPTHAVVNFQVDNMTATALRLSWRVLDQYDKISSLNTSYILEQSFDDFAPARKGLQDTVKIASIRHPTPVFEWQVFKEGNEEIKGKQYLPETPLTDSPTLCYYDKRFICIYFTISGLNPGDPVHYRVRALNANTAGLSTVAAYLKTAPYPCTQHAGNLRVTNVTDTSVLLEWSRPEGAIGTSVVWNQVTWSPDGRVQVDGAPIKIGYNEALKTLDGACVQGICWFNATGLTKARLYTFHIRLSNNHESGYEPGILIKASPVGVPDPPSQLFVQSVTTKSIHVRWRPPRGIPFSGEPGVREPIKYRVRCRLMPGYSLPPSILLCNNKTHFSDSGVEVHGSEVIGSGVPALFHPYAAVVYGLAPGVGYRLQGCSGGLNVGYGDYYFEAGCGPFVEAVTSAPPAAVTLSSPGVQATSVLLTWTSAASPAVSVSSKDGLDMGWNFLEGMDVPGYTLTCPGGTVESLKLQCEAKQDCAGFNTFGCLKSYIPPLWLGSKEGREQAEWILMSELPNLLSAKTFTALAAASAESASVAAGAMPASAAPVAMAARTQASTAGKVTKHS